MNNSSDFFIFAGEQSGDLHGSHLMKALKNDFPDVIMRGVGGPQMRSQGLKTIMQTEDFEVMGFTDVVLSLPKLWKQYYEVRHHILKIKPQAVVLIDYPGFNLRLASALRKQGYRGKIVQYISPSVWAWGRHRITDMVNSLDLLLTIYPFEEACFSQTSLRVEYVGNPLQDYINCYSYENSWQSKIGIPRSDQLISLFPGSRSGEIKRNLPIQIEAAVKLKQHHPETCFAVSYAHKDTPHFLQDLLQNNLLKLERDVFLVPKKYSYEMMRDSRSAIAKSGTVTLELALHQRPTVVIYDLSLFNRLYAQHILKLRLPYYCIVNILANQSVYPELIEKGLTPHNLYQQIKLLHEDSSERQNCLTKCQQILHILETNNTNSPVALCAKSGDTSRRAANAIARLIRC
jgi:lipid-A-disaccharide synthase